MNIKVEYLITYNFKGNSLQNTENFKHLLMSNSMISFKEDGFVEFSSVKFNFEIKKHEIVDKEQRTFKITISTNQTDYIDFLSDFLRIVREYAHGAHGKITILWDDISNYYSVMAYPEINKIENLLRKLISYFMITNFGIDWVDETIPLDVRNNVKKNRDKNNFLHDTDFIHLADFLFKPYPQKKIDLLFSDIKEKKLKSTTDYQYLEEFLPRSNWERYFNSFVPCEDGYLSKNWTKLYDLRCLVAHNNFLKKSQYVDVLTIVNDLQEKFLKAIEEIENIIIPKEEREVVLENVLEIKNENLKEFFKEWRSIISGTKQLAYSNDIEITDDIPLSKLASLLQEHTIVTEKFCSDLKSIGEFRNTLLNINSIPSDEIIKEYSDRAESFYLDKFIFGEEILK